MFTDWFTAGMTQFLASAQGMPEAIIQRVMKIQEAFFWKGAKSHTVNKETLARQKTEGGMGLIDIATREEAIILMRLKAWLSSDDQPRWTKYATAIIAQFINTRHGQTETESQVHGEQRWDNFLQDWDPTASATSELKEMMHMAQKHRVSLQTIAPSQEIRKQLPIWHHI
ncbi:hypothetical protein PENSPDRAFT_594574, partial [Peniophora sp. CONT]